MTYKLCLPATLATTAAKCVLVSNPPSFVTDLMVPYALGNITDESVAAAARILEMGESTLRRHVREGKVPAYKTAKGEYRVQRATA